MRSGMGCEFVARTLSLMGLFVLVLRENKEMMYQFEHDYRFDSSKLEQALNVQATDYRTGIKATL